MPQASIIAIDGPSASGKSTLGKNLADALGYLFFDTGVMYRAITWLALQRQVPPEDEIAITALAEDSEIDIRQPSQVDGRNCDILADEQDITWEIRRPEVEANVSIVSAYPGVRKALSAQQRRIGLRGKVVMVGRDIGTVVLPEADLKIYLDASVEERARRRTEEIQQRNQKEPGDRDNADKSSTTNLANEVLSAMRKRDQIDSTRAIAPLRPAADAIIIDSDGLEAEEVYQKVLALVYR